MIHDRDGDAAPFSAENNNPFYLFCDGVPVPIAVRRGNAEAIAFRDGWEMSSTQEFRRGCLYDPASRNWVGGAEDGADAVARAFASA